MIDYAKRLVEVDEILKQFPSKELAKIPEDIRQAITQEKDMEYVWKYDTSKALKDQGLNRDTIAILAYLNMEYMLNDEQKKQMQNILEFNEKKYNDSIQDYNFEEIFKNNARRSSLDDEVIQEEHKMVPSEYTGGFFKKVICKIKRILRKV